MRQPLGQVLAGTRPRADRELIEDALPGIVRGRRVAAVDSAIVIAGVPHRWPGRRHLRGEQPPGLVADMLNMFANQGRPLAHPAIGPENLALFIRNADPFANGVEDQSRLLRSQGAFKREKICGIRKDRVDAPRTQFLQRLFHGVRDDDFVTRARNRSIREASRVSEPVRTRNFWVAVKPIMVPLKLPSIVSVACESIHGQMARRRGGGGGAGDDEQNQHSQFAPPPEPEADRCECDCLYQRVGTAFPSPPAADKHMGGNSAAFQRVTL